MSERYPPIDRARTLNWASERTVRSSATFTFTLGFHDHTAYYAHDWPWVCFRDRRLHPPAYHGRSISSLPEKYQGSAHPVAPDRKGHSKMAPAYDHGSAASFIWSRLISSPLGSRESLAFLSSMPNAESWRLQGPRGGESRALGRDKHNPPGLRASDFTSLLAGHSCSLKSHRPSRRPRLGSPPSIASLRLPCMMGLHEPGRIEGSVIPRSRVRRRSWRCVVPSRSLLLLFAVPPTRGEIRR